MGEIIPSRKVYQEILKRNRVGESLEETLCGIGGVLEEIYAIFSLVPNDLRALVKNMSQDIYLSVWELQNTHRKCVDTPGSVKLTGRKSIYLGNPQCHFLYYRIFKHTLTDFLFDVEYILATLRKNNLLCETSPSTGFKALLEAAESELSVDAKALHCLRALRNTQHNNGLSLEEDGPLKLKHGIPQVDTSQIVDMLWESLDFIFEVFFTKKVREKKFILDPYSASKFLQIHGHRLGTGTSC